MKISIIAYNAGNIRSVLFALERLGVQANTTDDPREISAADKVIFPGVGEASSAMRFLREKKLDKIIPQLQQPVLGICLGMQLMCEHSEEGNTDGLNIFPVQVKKFPSTQSHSEFKIPQTGWNTVSKAGGPLFKGIGEDAFVYYVHSFYAEICANTAAVTDYILPYSAALQKNNFHAVQFHPEKSGSAGEKILHNFLEL